MAFYLHVQLLKGLRLGFAMHQATFLLSCGLDLLVDAAVTLGLDSDDIAPLSLRCDEIFNKIKMYENPF